MTSSPSPLPTYLHGLVADAAALDPDRGGAGRPLPEAVRAHLAHRAGPSGGLVGPLLVGDDALPGLLLTVSDGRGAGDGERGLAVEVVVSGGAGAIQPAVAWASSSGALDLQALRVVLRGSDTGEAAQHARRILAAVDQLLADGHLGPEVAVRVALPGLRGSAPTSDWLGALDELAAADHVVGLRLEPRDDPGPGAVPGSHEVATVLTAALGRELRLTGLDGPARAVRQVEPDGATARHGLLNLLLATRGVLDGAGVEEVASVLDRTDVPALLAGAEDGLGGVRRWLLGTSSSDVERTTDELGDLDLLGGS